MTVRHGFRGLAKRATLGLALLALLSAMHSADAQRRRLPSRTEPIPDTETGAKAGSAGSTEPSNPSLMIYGPPVAPLGAPPDSVKPAPPPPPTAAPAPAPVAAPALRPDPAPAPVATPAPVVAPVPPPPPPVAVPIPAPAPPAPAVATPAPAVPPVTAPAPPPPAPVAAPAPPPVPVPPPVAAPAPPPPVATPVPVAAPVVAPAAIAAPKPPPVPAAAPAAKPAPEKREVAAVAPAAAIAAQPRLDPKLVEQIFSCLAPGLPSDWKKTWVVVNNTGGAFAGKFLYTSTYRNEDAEEFTPCNAQEVARRIGELSTAADRSWRSARLQIDSEGAYELRFDAP